MTKYKCRYDYASKCNCSEDDKCGCNFPNNMPHDFTCNFEEENMLMSEPFVNLHNLPDEIHLGNKFSSFKKEKKISTKDDSFLG